ncbi:hypothetical protein [Chishuiella sp.]|uniref:hypothetical protein n=1 Tax=Chishuiella sp. TaxID=1969467 RepID=UPI0028AC849D|nr:hypothetical protein [Chishuiella sp.]
MKKYFIKYITIITFILPLLCSSQILSFNDFRNFYINDYNQTIKYVKSIGYKQKNELNKDGLLIKYFSQDSTDSILVIIYDVKKKEFTGFVLGSFYDKINNRILMTLKDSEYIDIGSSINSDCYYFLYEGFHINYCNEDDGKIIYDKNGNKVELRSIQIESNRLDKSIISLK